MSKTEITAKVKELKSLQLLIEEAEAEAEPQINPKSHFFGKEKVRKPA